MDIAIPFGILNRSSEDRICALISSSVPCRSFRVSWLRAVRETAEFLTAAMIPARDASDGGGDVVVPEHCDLNADVMASPKCIDDGIGVFVDAFGGNDTGLGTKASPYKTITPRDRRGRRQAARLRVRGNVRRGRLAHASERREHLRRPRVRRRGRTTGDLPNVGKSALALHVDGVIEADRAFRTRVSSPQRARTRVIRASPRS